MPNGFTEISADWTLSDYWGSLRSRMGISRNKYKMLPGLYALGNPDRDSPVLVTANYKLTVNLLKKAVKPLNTWILVLDTKGINVWCAAGKGTFGTEELINRINKSELTNFISHRKLVLPQLGAPGINPGKIKEQTGFSIIYGPVEAEDILDFINRGYKATDLMRLKKYPLKERTLVALTHFSQGLKWSVLFTVVFILLDLIFEKKIGFQLNKSLESNVLISFCSLIFGSFVANILLPVLPGRSFSIKGFFTGLLFSILSFLYLAGTFPDQSMLFQLGKIIILWTYIVFQVLNLTGSSTYTSLSGVQKEMSFAIPISISTCIAGIVLIILGGIL